ncbi:DUF4156 domain-containing protein [Methylocaldum szegediense]|uniref:Lipoprotein n=1 Tax=Methylocaldum szegediense TaxID=73780 RepID=A0ABM9I8A1_9GAMM|nr:DUF4156 domain-containing protein [Methylocaldum szegediense]CAI8953631.1 conserved protein of unknown function [Methylocaldum szegediense]
MTWARLSTLVFGVAVMFIVSGCTWVELTPGGEKVRELTPPEVGRCKHLGRVTSNTAATVGIFARSKETVQKEVNRLARNNAADMGGDTIVPAGPLIDGEQTFNVYRCINP